MYKKKGKKWGGRCVEAVLSFLLVLIKTVGRHPMLGGNL